MGRRRSESYLSKTFVSQVLISLQDTFVVGCRFSDKCIYPETFEDNADANHPVYSTEYGIYEPHCGLDKVMLSWGHDEVFFLLLLKSHVDSAHF